MMKDKSISFYGKYLIKTMLYSSPELPTVMVINAINLEKIIEPILRSNN